MDYKPLLTTLKDFCVNFAVASFAVSAFNGVLYGTPLGALFIFIACYISLYLGGRQNA